MNRVSRTEEPYEGKLKGYNQSPRSLSADLTTNEDLNGNANARAVRGHEADQFDSAQKGNVPLPLDSAKIDPGGKGSSIRLAEEILDQPDGRSAEKIDAPADLPPAPPFDTSREGGSNEDDRLSWRQRLIKSIMKYGSFVGPGFMISVAYIDPGNYSTGVAAGATYEYRLLFVVLMANLFAIFLQTLCIKLGTVSGLNLAQACRVFLPRWMNYGLYFFAEVAIIATDIAEVIGFAIGLNLLFPAIPLVAGCAISILDVMLILIFYNPSGSMRGLRIFEAFIVLLVLGVVVCFSIQLSLIHHTSIGRVFKGYLPSNAIVESQGLYQACGILGATVMPHSLYLGSGIVQSRLRSYDEKHGLLQQQSLSPEDDGNEVDKTYYVPSLKAIQHSYKVSALELSVALFTFALFVNSAIVIVSGASLYNNPDAPDADIFSIHKLLSSSIAPVAGTIFALALLLSGVSAGIVCTISGQMVCEGALNWKLRPWVRRLVTRSISVTPSIIIAGAVGRPGLTEALNASQVVLSVVLPFVTAPLIYFTCRKTYMTVNAGSSNRTGGLDLHNSDVNEANPQSTGVTHMANSWYTTCFAVLLWIAITVLNVANLVLLGLGK